MNGFTTTPPRAHVVAKLDHLDELHKRFNGDPENDFIVFEKCIAETKGLPEPYLSAEIAVLQTAMGGEDNWLTPSDVERRIRAGKIEKKLNTDYQATVLYDEAANKITTYEDPVGNKYGYYEIESDHHFELQRLESVTIKDYLRRVSLPLFDKVVRRDVINSVIDQLHAREAEQITLSYRVAERDGAFYYDLSNRAWSAIKIEPGTWACDPTPPPLFITNKLQAAQAEPDESASIRDLSRLTDLLNVPDLNRKRDQELLTVVWLISSFVPYPRIRLPILYPYGEKGSGKTLLEKVMLQLADPTVADPRLEEVRVLGPPSPRDAITQLSHRHMAAYDNLKNISAWFATLLSIRVTGGSDERKKLYTDSDPHLMKIGGPIMLNGVHRGGLEYTDLQDRILALRLERLEGRAIKAESDFWSEFVKIRPSVLGAIFTTLSEAMELYPEIDHTPLSRFVDFERWGLAITRSLHDSGLGYSEIDFTKSYADNVRNVGQDVLEGHPLALCIMHLRDTSPARNWIGTPRELLSKLNRIAENLNVDTSVQTWPKGPEWLTIRLDEIKSNLKQSGIGYKSRRERYGAGTPKRVQRVIRLAFLSRK